MTKGEIQAVLFVAASMLAGGLVLLVKQFHTDLLPDLGPVQAEGRANAEIQAQSAQTTGNTLVMTGLSSGAGSDTGGGKTPGDAPHSRATSLSSDKDLRVPVNTAPAFELQKLPGIGPALAERIIAFREQSGGFSSVEQLLEVKGIGPAKLTRMRPFVELR